MKNKIIKHIFKIVLALALVISASVFISQDVNACPGDGCTCAPWLSTDGEDHRGACATTWMSCDFYCNGHWYPDGFQVIEWDDGHDANLAGSWHWHHVYVWAHCAWCGQNPDYQIDTFVWDHQHNWQHHGDWYRPNNEPCQIWANNYYTCNGCGGVLDADDTFLFWDHNQGIHWKETDVNGGRYHALWCNRHGWVNSDDCENHPQSSGSYAGLWNGVNTTSGTLKYYYHNLSSTNNGDSMHYQCTDCGHTHSLACTLTSTRADNNTFIGKSNINTAFIPGANDAWTNTDVKLTASQGNSIINKNTSAWLGSPQTITQEGTNIFYTYMSGHGNAVTSKEHYVKIDKTAPKLTGTSVKAGTYQAPATTSTAHDSESYGLKVTLKADDSNANARGGKDDVAKIKEAYVIVRDKDNANNSKRYNIDGVAGKVSINTSKVIDVNKDFHGVLDFVYEIHVIDYAGNDAVKTDTIIRNPEVFLSVKNVTQNTQLNGTNVFLGGEHGVLTITTTGYCDISNLKWNE